MTVSGHTPPSTSVAVPGLVRVGLWMSSIRQSDGSVKVYAGGEFVFRVSSMLAANSFVWREVGRFMDGVYRADSRLPRPGLPQSE
jgi:hypothetical protein